MSSRTTGIRTCFDTSVFRFWHLWLQDYRKLLTPILPQFVKDLARGLAVPLGEQSDVGLQKQIFRVSPASGCSSTSCLAVMFSCVQGRCSNSHAKFILLVCLQALGAIVQVFPKLVRHLFKDIIKPLWKVLTSSAEVYPPHFRVVLSTKHLLQSLL